MVFYYDRNDEAVGFRYKGSTYYYVKNLQGDITAIVDNELFLVCRYEYDDWGKCTAYSSEFDYNDIGNLNPFRWRSYYYDTESGLYYLQSRYYDPETGRFINADDVNYIGVSGTQIGYNPFAYCENEPVNRMDPFGLWAYDVHSGYPYKMKKGKVIFEANQIKGENYGTYNWAIECGYPLIAAWMIAESDNLVDKEFSAVTVNNFEDQSWHFNVNKNTQVDSRDEKFLYCYLFSIAYFDEANKLYDKGSRIKASEYLGRAYQLLGAALHPLQDKYAHTDMVTKYRVTIINNNGYLSYYRYYEHKVYDLFHRKNKADDAKAHWNVVRKEVKNNTKYYLKEIFYHYKNLIQNCVPSTDFSFFFPNSFKKAKPFLE